MDINDKTLQALSTAAKFREMRQEVIASNIANAETPEFKAKKLDFEEALARALDVDGQMSMQIEDSRHYNVGSGGFNNLSPEIYEDPNGEVSLNGNTVDVESEMSQMSQNKLMHEALTSLINKKIGMMKYLVNSEK